MNTIITHTITLVFLGIAMAGAQEKQHLGYRIDGEEIVFSFDVRDYDNATRDGTEEKHDFSDLDIYSVAVSGEFNNWSRKRWKMKKTGSTTYELRKKLNDLDKAHAWEFKFIINETYWAEPGKNIENRVKAKKGKFWRDVYNLKLYTAVPDKNGNIRFYLNGHTDARKVILSGSFNQWNEDEFEMKRTANGWELRLQLGSGDHEYKFIVDGKWMHDPANPKKRLNRFLTYNSRISITKTIEFTLEGFKTAKKVILSGDFNNWDREHVAMTKTDSGWIATLQLKGGKIHYKYIVDGKWITDPANPIKEYDGYGHINSVRIIE